MTCRVEGCFEPILRRGRCTVHMSEYNKATLARMKERSPERFKSYTLKRDYGIDLSEYELLLEAQENACAICKRPAGDALCNNNGSLRLSVDHDHETGQIRALLCAMCNKGIGSLSDDPDLLRKAASYIEYHRANPGRAIQAIRAITRKIA